MLKIDDIKWTSLDFEFHSIIISIYFGLFFPKIIFLMTFGKKVVVSVQLTRMYVVTMLRM